jgi:hypothetical protein
MGRQRSPNASPTERAIDECLALGWHPIVCEAWQKIGLNWRRKDFAGFGDIVACDRLTRQLVMIQVTDCTSHLARIKKLCDRPTDYRKLNAWIKRASDCCSWLEAGGRIVVWSWKEYKKPPWWRLRETEIFRDMVPLPKKPVQSLIETCQSK